LIKNQVFYLIFRRKKVEIKVVDAEGVVYFLHILFVLSLNDLQVGWKKLFG